MWDALVLVSSPATIPVSENKRLRVPSLPNPSSGARGAGLSALPAKGAQAGDAVDHETGYAAAASAALPLLPLNPQIRAGSRKISRQRFARSP